MILKSGLGEGAPPAAGRTERRDGGTGGTGGTGAGNVAAAERAGVARCGVRSSAGGREKREAGGPCTHHGSGGGAHSIRLGRERTRAVERHRSMEAEGERGRPFGLIAAVFLSEDTTKFLKRCFFIMERSIGLLGLFGTVSNQHTTGIYSIIKFITHLL